MPKITKENTEKNVEKLKVSKRKKKKKTPYRNYTAEEVQLAINEVRSGKTLRSTAAIFNMSKTSLFEKIHEIRAPETSTRGPASILSTQKEEDIKNGFWEAVQEAFPFANLNFWIQYKNLLWKVTEKRLSKMGDQEKAGLKGLCTGIQY